MVMEHIYLKMEENIRVNGLMVLRKARKCFLLGNYLRQMGKNFKGEFLIIFKTKTFDYFTNFFY